MAVGAFKEWLKFKSKRDQLGKSTVQLERLVSAVVRGSSLNGDPPAP